MSTIFVVVAALTLLLLISVLVIALNESCHRVYTPHYGEDRCPDD